MSQILTKKIQLPVFWPKFKLGIWFERVLHEIYLYILTAQKFITKLLNLLIYCDLFFSLDNLVLQQPAFLLKVYTPKFFCYA